jgi:hypothetical protein
LPRYPGLWGKARRLTTAFIIHPKLFDLVYFRLVWWLGWSDTLYYYFTIICLMIPYVIHLRLLPRSEQQEVGNFAFMFFYIKII